MTAMNPPEWLTDSINRNVYETLSTRHAPDVPYEAWLDHWFGRAIVSQNYPWFEDVPDTFFRPALAHSYALRLFTHSAEDLEKYHDDHIGAGLWLLISDIYIDWPDVPIEEREAGLLASIDLFRDLFGKRCGHFLSHEDNELHLLNCACYMWWEHFTHIAYPGDPDFERMRAGCFRVMEETLAIPRVAIQEAALHGLGHEVRNDERALPIIERFLAEPGDASPELLQYARAARTGCIQ